MTPPAKREGVRDSLGGVRGFLLEDRVNLLTASLPSSAWNRQQVASVLEWKVACVNTMKTGKRGYS